LISDKKRIAFLFGAGTSLARRETNSPYIPAIGEMTERIEDKLKTNEKYAAAIEEIKRELTSASYNIESLLSNIETKISVIGNGTLNSLTKSEFEYLDKDIREEIREAVSIHNKFDNETIKKLIQYNFAEWVCNAERKHAVEVFTTNYDYLFEIGFEALNVPYYDGFTGSYKPFFHPDSLEDLGYLPQQTKLWKIHGSLGLQEDAETKKIIRANSNQNDLLIYPSSLKYNNSKKQPYSSFMDRLNAFLKQDDAVLFTCGYSFLDDHINERMLSALNTNSSSHIYALYYDILKKDGKKEYMFSPDSSLAELAMRNRKISVLATRNAVIGSVYGTWKLKREPGKEDNSVNRFFDEEDAPFNDDIDLKKEQKGNETWTGRGELILPDFVKFVDFLKNMVPDNEKKEEKK
jgi:hypothetical protein